jgi:hypothetical protein
MSDNPLNLLKEELENDDVSQILYYYNYPLINFKNLDSNQSQCNPQIPSDNGGVTTR